MPHAVPHYRSSPMAWPSLLHPQRPRVPRTVKFPTRSTRRALPPWLARRTAVPSEPQPRERVPQSSAKSRYGVHTIPCRDSACMQARQTCRTRPSNRRTQCLCTCANMRALSAPTPRSYCPEAARRACARRGRHTHVRWAVRPLQQQQMSGAQIRHAGSGPTQRRRGQLDPGRALRNWPLASACPHWLQSRGRRGSPGWHRSPGGPPLGGASAGSRQRGSSPRTAANQRSAAPCLLLW
mmetsp:Transcript_9472/g.28846  ORF Transcript_9472/g.28846 Transcript_9472/m.28846 type:complete len:238 (-) Transcript_9472:809-1522(-)